jgi:glycosyltransferase involved in cell wall biosynthesis
MHEPLRVLQSFPEPRSTTNPYLVMLRDCLQAQPGVEVLTFAWRRALLGRYDVFHVHWPENLLRRSTPVRTAARTALFTAFLLRLSLTRPAILRTAHNLHPHQGVPPVTAWLLNRLAARTTGYVRLTDLTPLPAGATGVTIPHGHYRDWFASHPREPRHPATAVFIGLIRPYKDVEGLLRVFASTAGTAPEARLQVAGAAADRQLAERLEEAAAADPRVTLTLGHLPDADLVATVSRAQLVVLPYREMHNSGAALLALSLDRPVLVPDTPVNAALAAEVGPGWVTCYRGELTGDQLLSALQAAERLPAGTRPDLARRSWHRAGAEHVSAYRQALSARRPRR